MHRARLFSSLRRPLAQGRSVGRAGQAMIEYAITAGMLVLAVSILAVFLYAFREYGGRVLDLVASEYP